MQICLTRRPENASSTSCARSASGEVYKFESVRITLFTIKVLYLQARLLRLIIYFIHFLG